MSGVWKRSTIGLLRHRQTKEPGTDRPHLNHRATPRLDPTFHWTDQKLRVHAFYCVLALMILNLMRRKLAQSGIVLSIVEMMNQLTEINEVTLLYPAPQRSKEPIVQTQLSKMNDRQKQLASVLGLDRFLHN
jgi:transposase